MPVNRLYTDGCQRSRIHQEFIDNLLKFGPASSRPGKVNVIDGDGIHPHPVYAELAIYEDLAKAGIPHYTGADSFVRNGAYATCGVNYTDLGAKTADLAYSAITDGMDSMEDYYLMDGGIITVNTDTAAAMSLDYSCFDSMGTVVEVTTTKD